MINLPALLTELEKLSREATAPPWEYGVLGINASGVMVAKTYDDPKFPDGAVEKNTALIAQSRNSIDELIRFCRETIEVTSFYAEPGGYERLMRAPVFLRKEMGSRAREFRKRWGIE